MRVGRGDCGAAFVGALVVLVAFAMACGSAAAAPAHAAFKPRVGFAIGLLPAHRSQEVATSPSIPVLYHGGSVLRNVTHHTICWSPAGYHLDASADGGAPP